MSLWESYATDGKEEAFLSLIGGILKKWCSNLRLEEIGVKYRANFMKS